MAINENGSGYIWAEATGLMPVSAPCECGFQGALVPDNRHERDHIAVVYDKGDAPPEITVRAVAGGVHTVLANGVAIAVVASSQGSAPDAADVLLVERSVQHTN